MMWGFDIFLLVESITWILLVCFGFCLPSVIEIGVVPRNRSCTRPCDTWATWTEWGLRCSVQPSAQSVVSGELRPGFSVLPPLQCWKPSRMGPAQPLWAASSNALPSLLCTVVSWRGKSFSSKQADGSLFHFMPAPMRCHREEPCWLVLAGHSEAEWALSPDSLITTGAQGHLSAPLLQSLQFVGAFPVWGSPKLDSVF